MATQFSNNFPKTIGGIGGAQAFGKPEVQWIPDPPYVEPLPMTTQPSYPTWQTVASLQQQLLAFHVALDNARQETIMLHKQLAKIKETKDWLVGPENDNLSAGGGKTP